VSKPLIHVAVALVCRDGRWLVARRRHDAHLPGLWEFPGGKRRESEAPAETATRELREECGVDAVAEHSFEALCCEYADRSVSIAPVVCRWRSGEARPLGNAECRWVSLAELHRLEMPPINAEIVRQIEQMLSSL
jgi:mutator protein MutT